MQTNTHIGQRLNLNGAHQLKIEAINLEGNGWTRSTYGFANAIIE